LGEQEPEWNTRIAAIVAHPGAPQVLLRPEQGAWVLPWVAHNRDIWTAQSDALAALLAPALGAGTSDFSVLRYVHHARDKQAGTLAIVGVVELLDPAWRPPADARWADRAGLAACELARPEEMALIAAYLDEVESGSVPELRSPWARPGWLGQAAAWIAGQIDQHGYQPAGPPVKIKSWGLSCLLRAGTSAGDLYFKVATSRPLFANEALLMRELARIYPAHVPAPLGIDAERRWMLMPDFGAALGWNAPADVLEDILIVFSELQRDAVGRVDELLAMGCLDRRLATLPAQLEQMMADQALLDLHLEPPEVERLRELAPRLAAMCAELAAFGVPETLVHGDLHLDNVARPAGSFLFFDWTDACIAHPFFDTISIVYAEDQQAAAQLRDSYLRAWETCETPARLRQAWELAMPLSALHQAVSYRHIINSMEPHIRHESAGGMPYWLRKLLELFEQS
jgi:hypothetical protein